MTGLLLVAECLVDKAPVVDSTWDSVQTFVRVSPGALLARGATRQS